MEKQIDQLTQLGTDAVQSAISNYTQWFIISSLCWLAFGVACAIAAIKIWRTRERWEDDDITVIGYISVTLLTVIALVTVPVNLPTLLQPRAYAIHQLIEDAH